MDLFNHKEVSVKRGVIERFVSKQNWEASAQIVWERREEWLEMDFFGQSKWRTDLYDLSPEKFKNIIWRTE